MTIIFEFLNIHINDLTNLKYYNFISYHNLAVLISSAQRANVRHSPSDLLKN